MLLPPSIAGCDWKLLNRDAHMSKLAALLPILAIVLGCTPPTPDLQVHDQPTEVRASEFTTRVVEYLQNNQRSGSIIYEGNCTSDGQIIDSFRVAVPGPDAPPVQALRNAFKQDPRLTVKQDDAGRIRVVGGNVRTDLLDLLLPQVTFHSENNPRDAAESLETLAEVRRYMQTHRMKFVNAMNALAPMPRGAHLSATLKNSSTSEVLDRISQTFPGVWIYGECATSSGDRLVDFTFVEF